MGRPRTIDGPLKVVDLFSGIGGISLGFMKARGLDGEPLYDVRLLVDADKDAAATFKNNYPKIPFLVRDITTVDSSELLRHAASKRVDVVVGGPPCQGFSSVGKRLLDDKRNELLKDFIELAVGMQPLAILMENVPAILGANHGALVTELTEKLDESGYAAKTAVLQATDYGVPQIRRRAFLLALRRGVKFPEPFCPPATFERTSPVTCRDAIGDLPPLKAGEGEDAVPYAGDPLTPYQEDRRRSSFLLYNHKTRKHSDSFLQKISIIPEGGGNRDLHPELQFSDNYFSQAYARLSRKEPAYTITAHFLNPGSGRFIHYRDRRSISVREGARLQSFDDNFAFHGTAAAQARHIGNAVPPLMARAWAEHLARALGVPMSFEKGCEAPAHNRRD